MDYSEVISSAWKIVWKYKALWLFGILGSCGGSAGSSNGSVSWQYSVDPDFGLAFATPPSDLQLSLIIGLGAILIVALIFLAVFLSTIGRIGVTLGTLEADTGAESLSIGGIFRGSTPYFWRVFFLNLVIIGTIAILGILFGTVALGLTVVTLGLALLCLIPLLCVLVPLSWLLFIYIEQANVALIVEDLHIGAALRRGWDVFRGNIGPLLLIGIFVAIIAIGAGFLFSIPLSIALFPLIRSLTRGGDLTNLGLIAGLCIVVYLPVLFILNGIVRTYLGSVWTLTFVRLTSGAKV